MTSEEYEKLKKRQEDFLWCLESLQRDFEDLRSSFKCDAEAITTLVKAGVVPGAKITAKVKGVFEDFEVKRYEPDRLILQDKDGQEIQQHYMGMLKAVEEKVVEVGK